jgi:hypothetical protein
VIRHEELGVLVPGPAAAGVDCLPANNNLDLARFAGRLYLVWRTAPSHFASGESRLEVTSAPAVDGPWRHELTIAPGCDVREPRLLVDGERLLLSYAELGTDPKRFEPHGVQRVVWDGTSWSAPELVVGTDVVPWRIRRLGGRWVMLGYRNGERMYSPRPVDPVVELRWGDDLSSWEPPIDLHVGGCECELVELPDGRVVGLTRNEGPSRRGGDLLVASDRDHLRAGSVAVTPIHRKLDSPNLFLWEGVPWLVARRQPAHQGRYDLTPSWVPGSLAMRLDQAVWSLTRKRSALYRLDPDGPAVEHVADLPSGGDTSFAAVVPDGEALLVADYRSPASVGDVMWLRGQLGPTEIALHRIWPA